jgi:cytochrome c oxidase assembly protein subunit 15
MWTVTLLLWPQVVTLHLLGGFTTLSLLWLLVQRLGNFQWQLNLQVLEKIRKLRWLAVMGLLVVVMQIALGGWTSSNYAALACADLPTCHNEWVPPMDFSAGFNIFQHIGPNYLGGQMDNQARTAIHFSHRIGAMVTTVVLLSLSISLFMIRDKAVRYMAAVVCTILSLQIILGLSNVFFALPLPVAVAHNAIGAALLLALVALNHRIFTAQLLR